MVASTTHFLEQLRDILLNSQYNIRNRKKEIFQQTIISIKDQWATIKEQLTQILQNWCLQGCEAELTTFTEKGDFYTAGPLSQLASRLALKREEIQLCFSRVVDVYKDQEILEGSDLNRHLIQSKRYIKQIWDKHFEFQVEELEKRTNEYLQKVESIPYTFLQAEHLVDNLKLSIDSSLYKYTLFQRRQNVISRDKVTDSLMEQTLKSVRLLQQQRDKQWIQLTNSRRK